MLKTVAQRRRLCLIVALLQFVCLFSVGNQLAFSQGGGTRGGISYAKVRVRRTGIRYPRLTGFRDRAVMRQVNSQIDKLTREFGCSGRESYYRVRSNVDYAERDIFSIYASAQYWCGGPYPTNDDNISQTFDLRTGKQVAFTELFKNYEADKREILRVIFAREIEQVEKQLASGRPAAVDDCEGNPDLFSLERLQDNRFSYSFSKAGLKVQPQWPHVIEACAEIVTVPYSKLTRFAATDGLLLRAAR